MSRKGIWSRRADDYEALLKRTQYRFACDYSPEPLLRFAEDYASADPKVGLAEYGPLEDLKYRRIIRVGVIGTPESIDHFCDYMSTISRNVPAGTNIRGNPYDPIVFPDFPGIGSDTSFRADVRLESAHQRVIAQKLLEQDLRPPDAAAQIKNIVVRIAEELDVLGDLDSHPDVVAIVMPPFVQDACQHVGDEMRRRPATAMTPGEAFAKKMSSLKARSKQNFLDFSFADEPTQVDRGFWNFHHALKAHAMRAGIPTQLIWERSLRGEQAAQDPASIAWNLMTGIYYKAGNIPWEVEGLPYDTCFLGISFFKSSLSRSAATHTSLAQVFSGHGEGLVMKGGKAIKEPRRAAHMDSETAATLVSDALRLYSLHHPGAHPRRLVIHKTSRFVPDEIAGIEAAVRPSDMRLDLVSLSSGSDVRFLRTGTHPPLRGTCVKLSERDTAMFTTGYIPEFRLYPGARVPKPLMIRTERGESTRAAICAEIMALTKLNWNSSAYGAKEPITTLFASSVGSIMREFLAIPENQRGSQQTKYRFYM